MTSATQDRQFLDDAMQFLRSDGLLENSLTWIRLNMSPSEVFPENTIRKYTADTWEPSDVFPDKDLAEWAESNGFVKKTE